MSRVARETGYYWVRGEAGFATVAWWCSDCLTWSFVGDADDRSDGDVDVMSARLEPPDVLRVGGM